jgi:hypothetical protein
MLESNAFRLKAFVWKNLTRDQATELAAILTFIANEKKSTTTQQVANTIQKAATGR